MKPYFNNPIRIWKCYVNACCLTLLSLVAIRDLNAQPRIEWNRVYTAGDQAWGSTFYDIFATTDGGYAMCGTAHAIPGYWLVATEQNGNPRINNCYRPEVGFGLSIPYSLIETDDEALILAGLGSREVGENSRQEFVAARINHEGELVWANSYNQDHYRSCCYAVIEMKSGDLLFAGYVGYQGGDQDGYIVRTDPAGNVVWARAYGSEQMREQFRAMREVADQGVVVAGRIWDTNTRNYDFTLTKVDFEGEVIWQRSYEGEAREFLCGMTSCRDGFAMSGTIVDNDVNLWRMIRVDQEGQLTWARNIQAVGMDEGMLVSYHSGILRTPDDGFVLYGSAPDTANHRDHGVVIKISSGGDTEWARSDLLENLPVNYTGGVSNDAGGVTLCGRWDDRELHGGQAHTMGLVVKLFPEHNAPQIVRCKPERQILNILRGDSILFSAFATDIDDDSLNYTWRHNTVVVSTDTMVVCHFDTLGNDTVKVVVSDRALFDERVWSISVRDLFIASFSPDTLSLFLRRGISQTFSLDTVRAVEGDPVEYQWTLTDLDNFEREDAGSENSATMEFLRSGNYQMEGLAYRGESSDNVIWTIAVRSAILDFWPRELNLSVLPDSSGTFGVLPFNPESDSLSYRWEVDGDSVGSDSTVTLRFAWDDRRIGNPPHLVSAIVMDGAEGDTVRWEVTVQDPNTTPSIEGGEHPVTFGIISVGPNPFSSTTTIRYSTSGDAYPTRLTLHDLTGREVARLVDERAQQAGPYAVKFDGRELPAGVYLLRLEVSTNQIVRKIVLLR